MKYNKNLISGWSQHSKSKYKKYLAQTRLFTSQKQVRKGAVEEHKKSTALIPGSKFLDALAKVSF